MTFLRETLQRKKLSSRTKIYFEGPGSSEVIIPTEIFNVRNVRNLSANWEGKTGPDSYYTQEV